MDRRWHGSGKLARRGEPPSRHRGIVGALLALGILLLGSRLLAHGGWINSWESAYPDSTLTATYGCNVCHGDTQFLNPYGLAIQDELLSTSGGIDAAIAAVEPLDSDGDGFSNLTEITANTHPGDAADHPAGDTTPPSSPGSLTATPVSDTQIDLSWAASTDDVGVTHYNVYRDAVQVAQPQPTQWSDTGLLPGTTYSYYVTAEDAAGNESAPSATASATTSGAPQPNAVVVSADLPTDMIRIHTATVTIGLRNSGSVAWTSDAGFALGAVGADTPPLWGVSRVGLAPGETVAPGQEKTFGFEITAPDSAGSFACDWQMVQDGGAGWFGEVASAMIDVTSFADVPTDHWAWSYVEAICDAGIASGYPGEPPLYAPADPVDRGQMAVYISRALAGSDPAIPPGPPTATFPDVPAEHWACKYVEYAVANGVVAGYDDGLYHPDTVLDRGQMAVFIARAVAGGDENVPPAGATPVFPDVTPHSESGWCQKYAEYIASQGVASGYDDGLYHPEYVCSRDQMAVFVARAFLPPGQRQQSQRAARRGTHGPLAHVKMAP